jgi:DNA invertase Pin-like site-specific DNA recombinase
VLDSGVEVLFCDLPHIPGAMGRFVVTQMAAVAELEAGLISERTKAGLAVARKRGVKLGATGAWLARKHRAEAKVRAQQLAPVIRELQQRGLSMNGIAAELRKRKVATPRGGGGIRRPSPASCSGSKEVGRENSTHCRKAACSSAAADLQNRR